MTKRIDPAKLKHQIDLIRMEFPEVFADEQFKLDTLEGETELFECLSEILSKIRYNETLEEAVKGRMEELSIRKSRFGQRAQVMRKLALRLMTDAELRKAELVEGTLSVRATPPALRINNPNFIPEQFWKVERSLDLKAIKAELKEGRSVDGAALLEQHDTLAVLTR